MSMEKGLFYLHSLRSSWPRMDFLRIFFTTCIHEDSKIEIEISIVCKWMWISELIICCVWERKYETIRRIHVISEVINHASQSVIKIYPPYIKIDIIFINFHIFMHKKNSLEINRSNLLNVQWKNREEEEEEKEIKMFNYLPPSTPQLY